MSNISANNGGSLIKVQFCLNQSKCEKCFAPNSLISGILASNAGINCNEFVDPGRDLKILIYLLIIMYKYKLYISWSSTLLRFDCIIISVKIT